MIEKAASENNEGKRVAIYKKAQKLLTEEDVAIIPLFVDAINVLVSPQVKGLQLNAMDLLKLDSVTVN